MRHASGECHVLGQKRRLCSNTAGEKFYTPRPPLAHVKFRCAKGNTYDEG